MPTGKWKVEKGEFIRATSSFRNWVSADGRDADYPAEAGRYHLYVSHACPWHTAP